MSVSFFPFEKNTLSFRFIPPGDELVAWKDQVCLDPAGKASSCHAGIFNDFEMVFNLSDPSSLASQFLTEIRDKNIQKDALRFRKNLERLGEIMAYEISKKMPFSKIPLETPLSTTEGFVLTSNPVLITVLRAGIPYFQGFLNFFDNAECGFIGAGRKEGEDEISIDLDYIASPSLEKKNVILIDPMLATGKSFLKSLESLRPYGRPNHVYIAALVASPEGIQNIQKNLDLPFSLWTFSIDENLNSNFFILPGLGDAGDLSFGKKMKK